MALLILLFYYSFVNGADAYCFVICHFSEYVALFCSFLLGLGDSCFNTQIYSMLGSIWSMNSAPAVAIFKFVQVFVKSVKHTSKRSKFYFGLNKLTKIK